MIEHHDVVIVGAGPAGLATSIELARAGTPSLLLERRSDPSSLPRANGLTSATVRLLREWGVERRVRSRGFEVELGVSIRATMAGPELTLGPVSPEWGTEFCMVAQDRLEPILVDRARAGGAEVRFSSAVEGASQDGQGVTLELADGGYVHCRYAVAADGAHSRIRNAAGIVMLGTERISSWLSILFRAPLHRLLSEPLRPLYILGAPGFTCVMVPTEQGNRWACVVQVDAEQAAGWDTGRCRSFIVENAGDQELPVDVLDRKLFHMSAQVAEAFGKDRLLLAGDAAHPVPPTTGMGLNIAGQMALSSAKCWRAG